MTKSYAEPKAEPIDNKNEAVDEKYGLRRKEHEDAQKSEDPATIRKTPKMQQHAGK